MRSAAIRDVNFNLGEDGDGGDGGGGGEGRERGVKRGEEERAGATAGASYVKRARAAIHDLDHISSLRENSSTDYHSSPGVTPLS